MKNNKLVIIVIISLAFNVAVLSVFAFFLVRNYADEKELVYNAGRSCPDQLECKHFARRFGLRQERADSFAREMEKFGGEEEELDGRIIEARFELMELLHESQPDEKALMKKVEEISYLQGELEKILVKRLLQVNSLLSKSEKTRFHRMLQHRMGMRRGPKTFLPKHPEAPREGGRE